VLAYHSTINSPRDISASRSIRGFRSKEVLTDFIEHFAPFKFTYMWCNDDRATE